MPATLEQVASFLDADGLKYRLEDDVIRTGFQTLTYRDSDGDPGIGLVIKLEELDHDGEFLKIIATNIYNYAEGPHKAELLQLLLMISWETKMIQFEYDVRDGEVRAIVEFPIADSTLTKRQFMYCLHSIALVADERHEAIVAAMTTGELPERDDDENLADLWREFQEFVEQRKKAKDGDGHGLPG